MSRFAEPQDPDFASINRSLDVDKRLWPYDVAQSRAHARMLAARGIIGDDDLAALLSGLDAVEAELREGTFPFEDDGRGHPHGRRAPRHGAERPRRRAPAHRALAQRPGDHGRLALRARGRRGHDGAHREPDARAARGRGRARRLVAARLHAPPARPAGLPAHHLLAYVWMLARDRERIALRRAHRSPISRSARARWPASTSTPTAAWSPPSSASTA